MQFILENDELKVTVNSIGAEVAGVCCKKTGAQMSWQGNPEVSPRRAPLCWPYVGNLWNKEYKIDGKSYAGGIHGFLRDLEFVNTKVGSCLEFVCQWSEETLKMFPRKFKVTIRFSLEKRTLRQEVTFENVGEEELRFGFGYHPGYVIPFDDKHTTEDYEIRFDSIQSPEVVEVEEGYVSGKTHSLMTEKEAFSLHDRMFDVNSICMKGLTSKTIALVEKDTGKNITMDIEGFPYVLVWSVPGNPDLKFICMEPWHNLQDEVGFEGTWEEKPCAAVLQPGQQWNSHLTVSFNR